MNEANLNLFYVIFFYLLRCLVPLLIMLGISYLLRRFGLIKEPPRPPTDWNDNQNNNQVVGGGLHHD